MGASTAFRESRNGIRNDILPTLGTPCLQHAQEVIQRLNAAMMALDASQAFDKLRNVSDDVVRDAYGFEVRGNAAPISPE